MTKSETLTYATYGEGCLGRCAPGEPVFVICGRDIVGGDTVRSWAAAREGLSSSRPQSDPAREREKIAEARRIADEMDAYYAAKAKAGGGK